MLSTHSADLTILCKVVDNFGDIGFVYRLAKNLVQLNPQREIRIAVDNLAAFNKIESRVDPALAEQVLEVACADSLQAQEGAAKAGNEGKPKTAGRENICKAKIARYHNSIILYIGDSPGWNSKICFSAASASVGSWVT